VFRKFFTFKKQKFGAGYRVTIRSSNPKTEKVKNFFEKNIPGSFLNILLLIKSTGCQLTSSLMSGYFNFAIPREQTQQLVPFFKKLEKNSEKLCIDDVQLSITTLEEVFLTIANR
jgi:hypothetical protein